MTTTPRRTTLFTLPNAISFTRLFFAVGILIVNGTAARVALIAVASASDFLDGWLARRHGETTRLGALIDPIADRGFAVAAVASFLVRGELSVGQCLVLLSRDIATALGFLVARVVPSLRAVTFKARWSGKVVTALQLATLFVVVLAPRAIAACVLVVGIASVVSIVDYTRALWRARSAA